MTAAPALSSTMDWLNIASGRAMALHVITHAAVQREMTASQTGQRYSRILLNVRDLARDSSPLLRWAISPTIFERIVQIVPYMECGDIAIAREGENMRTRYTIIPSAPPCRFCVANTDTLPRLRGMRPVDIFTDDASNMPPSGAPPSPQRHIERKIII